MSSRWWRGGPTLGSGGKAGLQAGHTEALARLPLGQAYSSSEDEQENLGRQAVARDAGGHCMCQVPGGRRGGSSKRVSRVKQPRDREERERERQLRRMKMGVGSSDAPRGQTVRH